jgi:hypothetical protein
LLDRIDLPDVVRALGPGAGTHLAARRNWSEASLVQPALDGTGGGEVEVGVLLLQPNPHVLGPPAGVVTAALEDQLVQGVSGERAGVVVGGQGVGPLAEAVQQVLHGPQLQLHHGGDGGRVLAVAVASQDLLTDRYGERTGHGCPPGFPGAGSV